MSKGKYAIVISEDAMIYEDLAVLKELPAFGSIWDKAAIIRHNRSIYPTLTYPCHTSKKSRRNFSKRFSSMALRISAIKFSR